MSLHERRGSDTDYTDTANPADRSGDYFLSDLQFSVAAVITSAGVLAERVSYDAYGEARHHRARDVDGDGDVDGADDGLVDAAITGGGGASTPIHHSAYDVDADLLGTSPRATGALSSC